MSPMSPAPQLPIAHQLRQRDEFGTERPPSKDAWAQPKQWGGKGRDAARGAVVPGPPHDYARGQGAAGTARREQARMLLEAPRPDPPPLSLVYKPGGRPGSPDAAWPMAPLVPPFMLLGNRAPPPPVMQYQGQTVFPGFPIPRLPSAPAPAPAPAPKGPAGPAGGASSIPMPTSNLVGA